MELIPGQFLVSVLQIKTTRTECEMINCITNYLDTFINVVLSFREIRLAERTALNFSTGLSRVGRFTLRSSKSKMLMVL